MTEATATATATTTETKVTLCSRDLEEFQVDIDIACLSETVKNLIEDAGPGDVIPLPNVSSNILAKVLEFCNFHASQAAVQGVEEAVQQWNEEFLNVDHTTLFDLILAANYLNIKSLLDLTCHTVAMMIKGKTPEEIRKTFNITNDFTPEEEEQVRRENAWAFD